MSDSELTFEELKREVALFSEERDWQPFHTLKNLAMSIAIESAELMELFQWLEGSDSETLMMDEVKRAAVEEELADVMIYVLQFANRAEIDLSDSIRGKMRINASKYPVEKARGRSDRSEALQ